jgi:hypothetical protein
MNIKNILLIGAILINIGVSCERQPSDETKTSSSPDIIEHTPTLTYLARGGKRFHNKRIYFPGAGYERIGHLQKYLELGHVELIIYHKANWFRSESFEYIGTYGNESARKKLIRSIGNWFGEGNGGLWCPEQNVFIGGTRDKNICKKYAEYMKQEEQASKFSKIK